MNGEHCMYGQCVYGYTSSSTACICTHGIRIVQVCMQHSLGSHQAARPAE